MSIWNHENMPESQNQEEMYLEIKICIYYNASRQRNVEKSMQAKNESPNRNGVQSGDSSFLYYSGKAPTRLFAAFVMPVQPFADEMANHTCCDSHKKCEE